MMNFVVRKGGRFVECEVAGARGQPMQELAEFSRQVLKRPLYGY
jgi:hypothetical protein